MPSNPVDYERILAMQTEARLICYSLKQELYGRKVRFRAWLVGGKQRTGTICDAVISPLRAENRLGIDIAVKVDRADGRAGPLLDTWWGDLSAVEIIE